MEVCQFIFKMMIVKCDIFKKKKLMIQKKYCKTQNSKPNSLTKGEHKKFGYTSVQKLDKWNVLNVC